MFTTMEDLIKQTVAFSGYRTQKIISSNPDPTILFKIKDLVIKNIFELYERGFRRFITGGSSGFDLIVAKALIYVRDNSLRDIKIIMAIPYIGQEENYPIAEQILYLRAIDTADQVHYISKEYHEEAYLERNKYMLMHSSVLVCYYDGQRGGTMYTVNRAVQTGHEVINLCEGFKIKKGELKLPLFNSMS